MSIWMIEPLNGKTWVFHPVISHVTLSLDAYYYMSRYLEPVIWQKEQFKESGCSEIYFQFVCLPASWPCAIDHTHSVNFTFHILKINNIIHLTILLGLLYLTELAYTSILGYYNLLLMVEILRKIIDLGIMSLHKWISLIKQITFSYMDSCLWMITVALRWVSPRYAEKWFQY